MLLFNSIKRISIYPMYANFIKRTFYLNRNFQQKLNLFNENRFAYNIIQNMPNYKNTLRPELITNQSVNENNVDSILNQEFKNQTTLQLVDNFTLLSSYSENNKLDITEEKYDSLVSSLVENIPKMNDDQLNSILIGFRCWEFKPITSHNYYELWNALDWEYLKRLKPSNYNQTLFHIDLWFRMHAIKKSKSVQKALQKLLFKVFKLNSQQFVQLMFYLNVNRSLSNFKISHFELEYRLDELINEINIDEIGIVCMGFFKTQTKIKNQDLVTKLIQRYLIEMKNNKPIHELTLCAITKQIRYSISPERKYEMKMFLDEIINQTDKVTTMTNLHLALVASNIQCKNDILLNKIFQRFFNDIENVRLKELERFTFLLILYNFIPINHEDCYEKIWKELINPSRTDREKHPKIFLSCIHFLLMKGFYDYAIINQLLSQDFIKKNYDNSRTIGREVFYLNSSLDILCPDYQGNRLDQKLHLQLSKLFTSKPPDLNMKINRANILLFDVLKHVQLLVENESHYYAGNVIPHYEKSDIVIIWDTESNRPVPIPKSFKEDPIGVLRKPSFENKNLVYCCLMLCGINSYIVNLTYEIEKKPKDFIGPSLIKKNQLEKIGYKVILISGLDWDLLEENKKTNYLKNKILESMI